jgi:hypothetical protein
VGGGIDAILGRLVLRFGASPPSAPREALVAALNGVLGDYLADTGNPLAIRLRLRRDGVQLPMERDALAEAIPSCSGKLLVLVHGLCLDDLQWNRLGHDHGAALARDLGCTPVYLNYNTGLHISTNGAELADALERLLRQWPTPVRDFAIVSHSMGGLVARSACHYGAERGHAWPRQLRKLVFLGTPHHGAPMERGGNWIDLLLGVSPFSAPLARLGKIRSAGITDLRYGNLTDEDWQGRDRFARGDRRRFVPLPEGVRCYAIAATAARNRGCPNASFPATDSSRSRARSASTPSRSWHCTFRNPGSGLPADAVTSICSDHPPSIDDSRGGFPRRRRLLEGADRLRTRMPGAASAPGSEPRRQPLRCLRTVAQRIEENGRVALVNDAAAIFDAAFQKLVQLDEVVPRHPRIDVMTDVPVDVVPEKRVHGFELMVRVPRS